MAKDIDIGLPDGGEITVPAWSTEETQKQIMIILKSMKTVDENTLKKLEEAQRKDDKNSTKTLEALKDLSKDLKESNKMGFLGAMAAAAGAAGTALGGLGTAVGITAGAVTAFGGAVVAGVKATTSFATAYTDAIKPLTQTGVAFGSLGDAVDQSVMDLNTLGFSSAEAAQLINNSGTAFLRMGADGLSEFTKTMKVSAQQFDRFGMTANEATEYVATEIEERARAGLVDRLSATQMANLQMNILNDQIIATRRLGKSIDEIADFQKQVKDDPRIAGIINAFSGNGDQQRMIESLVTQLQAVPGLDGTDVADIIAAEMEGRSIESTEAYRKVVVALGQTPGALEDFTTSVGDSFKAVSENNAQAFEASQAKFDQTLTKSGQTIVDIQQRALAGDREAQGIMTQLNNDPASAAFVGQAAILAGIVERTTQTADEVDKQGNVIMNEMLETATKFDNTIIEITGAFTEQMTRSQQAMVDSLDAVGTALVDSGIKDTAKNFATQIGDLAVKGINTLTTNMGTLATDFANFSKELTDIYSEKGIGGVAERIYQASVDNIVKPIGDAIMGLFSNPTVVTALVAAVAIPFAAQVVTTAAAMAITKAIMGGGTGGGVDGVVPGGGTEDDKDPKKKSRMSKFGGVSRGVVAGGTAVLAGALEMAELASDIGDINKDLKEGTITRSEAQIAKTAETSEAVGGAAAATAFSLALAAAVKGGAIGTAGFPGVGTAVGALVAGGLTWYAARAGARAIGEGLGEALFTPEIEALQSELVKVEERLAGDINNRTRRQLEIRKEQVQAELERMQLEESLAQPQVGTGTDVNTQTEVSTPVNPNNIPIMTTYTGREEEPTTGTDDSDTATKKQTEIQSDLNTAMSNQQDVIEKLTQNLDVMIIELQGIKSNTGKTTKGLGAIADGM